MRLTGKALLHRLAIRLSLRVRGRTPWRGRRLTAVNCRSCSALLLLCTVFVWAAPSQTAPDAKQVIVLSLDGAVSPGAADYLVQGMRKAAQRSAALIVLRLDTPGGLDTSMRSIVQQILASPVPVAAYVAPGGARAASAGTYLIYASHFAAMAPGTNLGAATPMVIGAQDGREAPGQGKGNGEAKGGKAASTDTLKEKRVNDAAAYLRSLAQLRERNVEWAERAVREAVSLSAAEALKLNVIDVIAASIPELLERLDGRKITTQGAERKLATAGAEVIELKPDWRAQLLMVITNPQVALVLMMIGIYGLIFEFANPGFMLPGVIGGICLLLALFAFQLLPINYAGLALIVLGIAFIVGEAFMPSFGALGLGGIAAFVAGCVILVDPDVAPGLALSLPFIASFAALSSVLLFATVALALKARQRPVVSGREDLISARGIALEDFEREGWARVAGETWRVESPVQIKREQPLRVVGMSGLTLRVEPETKGEQS